MLMALETHRLQRIWFLRVSAGRGRGRALGFYLNIFPIPADPGNSDSEGSLVASQSAKERGLALIRELGSGRGPRPSKLSPAPSRGAARAGVPAGRRAGVPVVVVVDGPWRAAPSALGAWGVTCLRPTASATVAN